MKQYESYKESNILWLDRIPSHWTEKKLKHLVSCNDDVLEESTEPNLSINYVEISDVDSIGGVKQSTQYFFKDAPSRARRKTRIGDVIISTVRTYLKAIASIKEDNLIVSTGFAVLRPQKVDTVFISYALLNESFLGEVVAKSTGVSYPAITSTDLIDISIPVPSLSEQRIIASYLDYKVGQIDSVIAEKEKMLADLRIYRSSVISEAVTKGLNKNVPMKDSGIDCLGSVPKHWRVTRLKFIADNYDGTHFSPETREFGMPYITAGDIRGKGINYDSAKKISQEDYCRLVEQGCKIEKGDVLLVKDGATTGRVGLMTDEMECVALSSVAMLRPHDDIDSLFLMYYMESYSMQTQIVNSMAGSAMPRITLTKLNEFIVNVPPIKEQKVITSFIDNEVEQIDIITIEIEKEIEDLKSYKSSVITEAVTGKVDLREWNKQNVTA